MIDQESILIVDDCDAIRAMVASALRREGYDVLTASCGEEAIILARDRKFAVGVVDECMPGMDGIATTRSLKLMDPDIEIIIFTGNPSLDVAVQAIREKVFEFLCKPVEIKSLVHHVRQAAERRNLIKENRDLLNQSKLERAMLQKQLGSAKKLIQSELEHSHEFIGDSDGARQVRKLAAEVALSDLNVLLLGESGVGKDVIARHIHMYSGREPNAFHKVNLPSIPPTLLESELFGHEKGAFTGATSRKLGRFECAPGGTIFLDEIGDLPLSMQSKLLQVIEQKTFHRIGNSTPIKSDIRIIAATNQPLEQMIESGKFRLDLFYRINEFSIHIPSLRERKKDITSLAEHFLESLAPAKFGAPIELSDEAMSRLQDYSWPGNVRELQSYIRRFALTGDENEIRNMIKPAVANGAPKATFQPMNDSIGDAIRNAEVSKIISALQKTNWNRRRAAERLEMNYFTLRRRIKKYGLDEKSQSF